VLNRPGLSGLAKALTDLEETSTGAASPTTTLIAKHGRVSDFASDAGRNVCAGGYERIFPWISFGTR
jgi:hypothetical protein